MQPIQQRRPTTIRSYGPARQRGAIMVYTVVLMTMFTAICSLAVDYGHVQRVKTELQRAADATARGYMIYYTMNGTSYANSHGPSLYTQSYNPMDSNSGIAPTVTVTWGYWNATSSTFSTSSSSGTTTAVKVTITRTAANHNAVPLWWGFMIGVPSCDVHASSIATVGGGTTSSTTVQATSNPYFAGMPNGTTNYWGDTTATQGATQVSIPVTPGTYMTFSKFTGTTSVVDGTVPYVGPAGLTTSPSNAIQHGQSYDGTWSSPTGGPYSENGIANAIMPDSALVGLFLTNNAPTSTTAPATVDWTQSSQVNQPVYSNIAMQQPFMIGNGVTTGGLVQKFLVPAGATRFYLGIWDGAEYNNNGGTLSGTVTSGTYVELVQ